MTKNLNTVIKANGKTYYLNFGMSAFINLEVSCGVKIEDILEQVDEAKAGENKSLATLYWLIKAGLDRATLKDNDKGEIFDFMDDLEVEYGIEGAVDILVKAMEKSMFSEKAKAQQEHFIRQKSNKPNKKPQYRKKK